MLAGASAPAAENAQLRSYEFLPQAENDSHKQQEHMSAEDEKVKVASSSQSIAPSCAFSSVVPPLRLGLFDLGGVLHHGNYLNILEAAREAFLQAHGISYSKLAAENKHLAVVEAKQSFLRPIRYGEQLQVHIWVDELSRVSATICHELSHTQMTDPTEEEQRRVLHRAQTKLVFVMEKNGALKTSRLPDELTKVFSQVMNVSK